MKILINRIRIKEKTTDGLLSIDGQHICETAEATPTLLPAGTYQITIFKCTKSKRQIPLICEGVGCKDYGVGNVPYKNSLTPKPSPLTLEKRKKCSEIANETEKIRMSAYYKLQKSNFPESARNEMHAYEEQVMAEARIKIEKIKTKSPSPLTSNPSPLTLEKCKKCTEVESQRAKIRMAEYYQIEKAAQCGGSREEVIAYEQQVVAEAQAKLNKLKAFPHPSSLTPHLGTCPRLHFGNGVYNLTDGSIIVGRYLQPGIVLHSRDIFDRLYDRIEKAIARGTQVQLIIN